MSADAATIAIPRESIVAEQLRLLLKSSFPIYSAVATAALAVIVLHRQIEPAALYGWGGIMLLWQLLRFIVWQRFRGIKADDAQAIAWTPTIVVLMTGCGLLWGVVVLELYHIEDFELRIFTMFIVTSMMTGGAVTFMAHLPSFYGYLAAAILPIVAAFLWHGTTTSLLIAGMSIVYVTVLIFTARAANRGIADLIALQLEKAALVGDLRRAKDGAENANRVKSHFLANMSHELRTPLNAIIGFSDIIGKEMFGPVGSPRYRDYVRDINRSGHHLLSLVNDILDLSKLEAKAMDLAEERVDLGAMVADCVRLLRTAAAAGGVNVVLALPDPLPPVLADELRLKQVVLNLLSNAIKFSRPGGVIDVTGGPAAAGGLALIVRDHGIGMTPDDIKIALEPFRQVDSAFTRRYAGTGLGLPLAKSLIERHGGTLEIESERNVGTAVALTLPAQRVLPAERARRVG
jgi:signal transduction histidine kinase